MSETAIIREILVAVPCPLPQALLYSHPHELAPGLRVVVPLGKRSVVGVVMPPRVSEEKEKKFQLKPITEVVDATPIFSPTLIAMGQWISNYYHQPVGWVFKAMLPAGKIQGRKKTAWRTFPEMEEVLRLTPQDDKGAPAEGPPLTGEQRAAIEDIHQRGIKAPRGEAKPFLLHGVTGSGKTEVYLQLIALLLKAQDAAGPKPQTLIMVPEISLTPQMTQVFLQRFPGEIAVVHSGMGDKERWQQLGAIRTGTASILIGPRSAVFAPFHQLGLIVVDEEHDSSYKQSSSPPYHGRDMAILRGKLEHAVVVLGSATPSLESFYNAHSGRYHLLTLSSRVHQKALPSIEAITQENKRLGLHLHNNPYHGSQERGGFQAIDLDPSEVLSPEVVTAIGEILAQKEQAMIIVNRRGFAPFLLDTSKGEVLQCPHCSISLTFHSAKGIAQCHYCDYRESIARLIAKDERSRICAVGHGSQKVELLLQKLFPEAVIVRCDSDSVAGGKSLEGILANFREKKIDLLVGTQMLAKGHDFPNVTLVALLEIDAMLHLPDFRAGERTFQLMVQAAGRTGRADKPGRVLLQTLKADNRIVSAALHHDYLSFAEEELRFRRRFNYPPYSKIAVIELTSAHDLELAAFGGAISTWLTELSRTERELFHTLRILGPGVPAIAKVRQRYRRTMVVMAPGATQLHYFLGLYLSRFAKLPAGVRQNLDVDPQSLL